MTERELQQVLDECTQEVLEQMFFVRVLGSPPGEMAREGPCIAADVSFHGEPSGCLTLVVSAASARSIAADFLGEEECVLSHQQIGEVICELANIICGSVLSRVESQTTFRLESPQLRTFLSTIEQPNTVIHSMSLENGMLRVAFWTNTAVCPMTA